MTPSSHLRPLRNLGAPIPMATLPPPPEISSSSREIGLKYKDINSDYKEAAPVAENTNIPLLCNDENVANQASDKVAEYQIMAETEEARDDASVASDGSDFTSTTEVRERESNATIFRASLSPVVYNLMKN